MWKHKVFRQENRNPWPVHAKNICTPALTDSKMKISRPRQQGFSAQRNSRKSLQLASLQLILYPMHIQNVSVEEDIFISKKCKKNPVALGN